MIVHHSFNCSQFNLITLPSGRLLINDNVRKNFKAIGLVVYLVGMTKAENNIVNLGNISRFLKIATSYNNTI